MVKAKLTGKQVKDHSVQRDDVDVSTSGQALIAKLIAGGGILLSSTGADSGTGDVTVSADPAYGLMEVGDVVYSYRSSKSGCLLADRSNKSRTTYADLYNYANNNGLIDATGAVETMFGPGNGSTTFDLPDLRLKYPFGAKAEAAPAYVGAGTAVASAIGGWNTVTAPSSTTTGNLLLLVIYTFGTILTAPSGWRLAKALTNGIVVYTKVAEGNTLTSTADDAQVNYSAVGANISRIFEFSGVEIAKIDSNGIGLDVAAGTSNATGTNPNVTGVTTVRDNAMLVYILGDATTAAITTPGTLTERSNTSGTAQRLVVGTKTVASAGASGTEAFTCGTSAAWGGMAIALRPTASALGRYGGIKSYEHDDHAINDHNFTQQSNTTQTGSAKRLTLVVAGDGPGDTETKATHAVGHHGGHVNVPLFAALNPFIKT